MAINASKNQTPSKLKIKRQWLQAHKKLVIIITVIVFVLGGGAVAVYYATHQKSAEPAKTVVKPAPKPTPKPQKYYSPLTGVQIANEAAAKQPVTAVMIENSPDARPQSGLKDSGVVFEAIAEGGITRFLVLYQEQKPQLIGPVRSVRIYYIDWLAAFNASVAHVGGSPKALQEIRNGSYRDIDQFFNAGSYWRSRDRYAPHNVYTSFERLDTLNAKKGYTSSTFTGFSRKDSEAAKAPSPTALSVKISGPLYNSTYAYNPATNTYDRSQAGKKHLDRENGQISPRVVIVMMVEQRTAMEDGGREQINAIGSGTAYVFQDGTAQKVAWHKKDRTSQITFADEAGKDVPLARGQTWITAVPSGRGGVTW